MEKIGDIVGWEEMEELPENEAITLYDAYKNLTQKYIDITIETVSEKAKSFYERNKHLSKDEFYTLARNTFTK